MKGRARQKTTTKSCLGQQTQSGYGNVARGGNEKEIWRLMGKEMIDLSSLKPNKRNPRKISDQAFEKLCASIKRDPKFMELRPIIIDEDGVVIAGNQRYLALKKLGKRKIPTTWVRRAVGLTKAQRKRFILIDNAPEGISGYWDFDILTVEYKIPELELAGIRLADPVNYEQEWQGMPEFVSEDKSGYQRIVMHFRTKRDVQKFAKLIGQKITEKTEYLWFPEKIVESEVEEQWVSES